MRKSLRYNVGGSELSRLDAMKYYCDLAENYSEPTKAAFLNMINAEFSNDQDMDNSKTKFQTVGVPIIGIFLLLIILYITIFTPYPSQFQSSIFWVILSLAAAMSAVMITGNIHFAYGNFVKAGGAIAVFCIMYFFVPSIYDKTDNKISSKLSMTVVSSDSSGGIEKIIFDFDQNSSKKVTEVLSTALSDYLGLKISAKDFTYFRKSDGKIYTSETCNQLTELDFLVISNFLKRKFPNKRAVYNYYKAISADAH